MEQGGNIPDKIWAFLFPVWKNQRQGENLKDGKVDCMSLLIYCYEYEANTRERRHSRLLVFLKAGTSEGCPNTEGIIYKKIT